MFPILAQLGPVTLYTHDVLTIAGLAAGLALYYRALRRSGPHPVLRAAVVRRIAASNLRWADRGSPARRARPSGGALMSADAPAVDPVRAWLASRPPLTRAQKYDRLAFTFCKMGTVGLVAWLVTPPIFVLAVALVAIGLYGKAVTLGIARSQCILRRPLLIMGFWAAVAAADFAWLFLL